MKIAWICHFYNYEIQSILHPAVKCNEMAAWMPLFAKLFEGDRSIELHIIAPDSYITGIKEVSLRGIYYHFFNPDILVFGYNLLSIININERVEYIFNKIFIRRIIKKIQPDIIHLFGAENAYYSSTIFQFRNKYPVLVTIQGFISKTSLPIDKWLKKRIQVEKLILKGFKHFAYCTQSVADDIVKFNPEAELHFHDYPVPTIKIPQVEKIYDIVYFARLCKDKGFDDLLIALSIIKHTLQKVNLCVIGEGSGNYIQMVDQLELTQNVQWVGHLPELDDVHKMASCAKICVLPTYHDTIPGTIIESMFLKLPVVSYSTGGIPVVNANEECLALVDAGDVNGLAEKILWLLLNPDIREEYGKRAFYRAIEMFDNSLIAGDIISAYNKVIEEFKKK